MNESHLRRLDTTALLVFNTLMEEGSVSRAAARLGMTQSAVSHALRRLRALWRDPLFVRSGGAMQPTHRALALAPGATTALRELRALVDHDTAFDQAAQQRRFVIGMSDYTASVFLPELSARCAPFLDHITFLVRHTSRAIGFEMLDRGEVECVVGNFPSAPKRMRQQTVFEDRFICAARSGGLPKTGDFTLDRYLDARHAHVSLAGEPSGLPDQALSRIGRKRHVAMTVGHFLVLPQILAASPLVATEPRAVIEPFRVAFGLEIRDPPFEIDSFSFSAVWHGRSDGDPALTWLLQLLASIAESIGHPGDDRRDQ